MNKFGSSFKIVFRIRLFPLARRDLSLVAFVDRLPLQKEILEHLPPFASVHFGHQQRHLTTSAHALVHFWSTSCFDQLGPYTLIAATVDRRLYSSPLVQLVSLTLRRWYRHCPIGLFPPSFVDNDIVLFGQTHTQLTIQWFARIANLRPIFGSRISSSTSNRSPSSEDRTSTFGEVQTISSGDIQTLSPPRCRN